MTIIQFDNPGEIDLAAITTFGVSVKDSSNPIGMFGTGFKYALAVLLRNKCSLEIWSGLKHYKFAAHPTVIRGEKFDIIHLSEAQGEWRSLGFSTQLGKNWELWMAYRELVCNCKDENGTTSQLINFKGPKADHTYVLVQGSDFITVHQQRSKFFLDSEPDMVSGGMQIFARKAENFFYRGIAVATLPKQSLFTYNTTDEMTLTEDRTARYPWNVGERISFAIQTSLDKEFIRECILAPVDTFEHELRFHDIQAASPEFLEVCLQERNRNINRVNPTALEVLQKQDRTGAFSPKPHTLTPIQQKQLAKAIAFCHTLGYPVDDYPIIVSATLGEGILGLALDEKIWLSETIFLTAGTKGVAATLIEEFIHLHHRFEDCSRRLQQHLFDKIVSLGEDMLGEPL